MSLFCPTCHNLLDLSNNSSGSGGMIYACHNCPYAFKMREKVVSKKHLITRLADDAVSAREEIKKNPKTPAVCPECNHNEAYFFQLQIRSGDEAMTTFFQCVECAAKWKEE